MRGVNIEKEGVNGVNGVGEMMYTILVHHKGGMYTCTFREGEDGRCI